MLVDVRTYRCKPGTLNAHLALYEEFGLEPQFRCLGSPLAYLRGESGDPNEYIHIWVYKNAADREEKRAMLWADPDWLDYVAKSTDLGALETQSNRLLNPVSFCPLIQGPDA